MSQFTPFYSPPSTTYQKYYVKYGNVNLITAMKIAKNQKHGCITHKAFFFILVFSTSATTRFVVGNHVCLLKGMVPTTCYLSHHPSRCDGKPRRLKDIF